MAGMSDLKKQGRKRNTGSATALGLHVSQLTLADV
jgi:hypothetical protein